MKRFSVLYGSLDGRRVRGRMNIFMYVAELFCWPPKTITILLIDYVVSHSVVSDSLQPNGLQPTRLFCSWNSPDKNTGVGCHFLLQSWLLILSKNSCNLVSCSREDTANDLPQDTKYLSVRIMTSHNTFNQVTFCPGFWNCRNWEGVLSALFNIVSFPVPEPYPRHKW